MSLSAVKSVKLLYSTTIVLLSGGKEEQVAQIVELNDRNFVLLVKFLLLEPCFHIFKSPAALKRKDAKKYSLWLKLKHMKTMIVNIVLDAKKKSLKKILKFIKKLGVQRH